MGDVRLGPSAGTSLGFGRGKTMRGNGATGGFGGLSARPRDSSPAGTYPHTTACPFPFTLRYRLLSCRAGLYLTLPLPLPYLTFPSPCLCTSSPVTPRARTRCYTSSSIARQRRRRCAYCLCLFVAWGAAWFCPTPWWSPQFTFACCLPFVIPYLLFGCCWWWWWWRL